MNHEELTELNRDALIAEIERLYEEGSDRMAERLLEDTRIRSMDFRNGAVMDIEPARQLAAIWVAGARAMLGDAENYSETSVSWEVGLAREPERYALIVQRVGKLSPHEARLAAEAERDQLREALAEEEYQRVRWTSEAAKQERHAEEAEALVEKVRHRHRPVEKDGVNVCHECDGLREEINPDAEPVLWPCPTVSDLDGDNTTETETRKDAA